MNTAWGIGRTAGEKAGIPRSRAGLGRAPAGFRGTHPPPSPGGEFAAERPLAVLLGDP